MPLRVLLEWTKHSFSFVLSASHREKKHSPLWELLSQDTAFCWEGIWLAPHQEGLGDSVSIPFLAVHIEHRQQKGLVASRTYQLWTQDYPCPNPVWIRHGHQQHVSYNAFWKQKYEICSMWRTGNASQALIGTWAKNNGREVQPFEISVEHVKI